MTANLILGATGSVITLVFLFEMMRRHRLREKYAVFWVLVAVLALVVAVFPSTLVQASHLVGVQVPSNLLFFVASMVLLVVSIQHSHELGRMEERTRTLAEEVGLLRLDLQRLTQAPRVTAPGLVRPTPAPPVVLVRDGRPSR